MKKGALSRIASLVLVLAMLVGMFAALAVTGSAATNPASSEINEVDGTLPAGAVVWDGTTATSFAGGSGTPEDPYLIADATQYALFAANIRNEMLNYDNTKVADQAAELEAAYQAHRDANFAAAFEEALAADETLTEEAFESTFKSAFTSSYVYAEYPAYQPTWATYSYKLIGNIYFNDDFVETKHGDGVGNMPTNTSATAKTYPTVSYTTNWDAAEVRATFYGTFDGNGYTMYNPYFSHGYKSLTLFGNLRGTVKNLNVLGGFLRWNGGNSNDYSLITNSLSGTLDNVHIRTYIYGTRAGSPLAYNVNNGATVNNCSFAGKLNIAQKRDIGGLFGVVSNGSEAAPIVISNCTNYAVTTCTTGSDNRVGGIAGYCGRWVKFVNCVNYGDITSKGYTAGIANTINHNSDGIVYYENCANYGEIKGNKHAGGMCGTSNYAIYLTNCVNYGNITATDTSTGEVGGLVGQLNGNNYSSGYHSSLRVYNSANHGNITGGKYVGGFVGTLRGGSNSKNRGLYIDGGINTGVITGTNVGAAAGYIYKNGYLVLEIQNAHLNGAIAGPTSAALDICTVGENVYIDKTVTNICGTANDNARFEAAYQYSASHLTDGTALSMLNVNAVADGYEPWAKGETHPELLAAFIALDGANLELTGNLTMNFKMQAANIPVDFVVTGAKLVANNKEYEGVISADHYTFAVKDIKAADMGDARDYFVVLEITTGEGDNKVVSSYKSHKMKNYSPLIYAQNITNRKDDPKAEDVRDLLQAMVKYAYYAEVMVEGDSTVLADYQAATGIDLTEEKVTYLEVLRDDVDPAPLADYVTVSANLGAGANLVFKANDGVSITGLKLTAGGETKVYDAHDGYVEITDVHAGMMLNKLNITLLDGETELASGTYSVANFLNSIATGGFSSFQKNAAIAASNYMWEVGQYQNPGFYTDDAYEKKVYDFATSYSYTFDSQVFASGSKLPLSSSAELNGVVWTIDGKLYNSGSRLTTSFNADYNAMEFGNTGTANVGFGNVTITSGTEMQNVCGVSITIFTRNTTTSCATLEVLVDGVVVGTTSIQAINSATADVETYTFYLPEAITGEVTFHVTVSSSKKPTCIRDWSVITYGEVAGN